MTDWGAGQYERTAAVLAPAAQQAVSVLAPSAGERVLDVACGTGNAALLVAAASAEVVGIDLAERLVEIAAERAHGAGLSERSTFIVANAEKLPFADDSFDTAISVFGVIFAEPGPAVSELLRVIRPGGRIVVTSWIPTGGMFAGVNVLREALGATPRVDRWAGPNEVQSLFEPQAAVHIAEHTLTTVRSRSSPISTSRWNTIQCGWRLVKRCRRGECSMTCVRA